MPWQTGDLLLVRGAEWRVTRCTAFADCQALDLAADRTGARRTLLLPFDRPRRPSPPRFRLTSRRFWAHASSSVLRSVTPFGSLQSCPPTIDLLPYQLEPALAVLRHGVPRVLIADEAGLGKTVEAGLIAAEVLKRNHLARALVVCPAAIRAQWAQELTSRFGLAAAEADAVWLRRRTRELPAHVNPWSLPGMYLASMDFVKRPEALYPLEDVRWDLMIVDEAHGATPGSDRRAAIHALARRSRTLVLLTATPHPGDEAAFEALCRIGGEAGSPPVVLFRRTRAGTQPGRAQPRSSLLAVRPTAGEERVRQMLDAYTARLWMRARGSSNGGTSLLATVLKKRSLSSPATVALSLERRLQLLAGAAPRPSQLHLPLHPDDETQDEDSVPDDLLGIRGLDDTDEERDILSALAEAAWAAAADPSKLRRLRRFLRRVREPAIVFTEYRDTADHVRQALAADGHRTLLLHGGISSAERHALLRAFARGGAVLVATDAASEGLNLHYACRLVVHFELPWTPSRLHQRRGRVDRIGQTRRVHEIALVAHASSEQLVLLPLIRRAASSRALSGPTAANALPESRVAALVFGGPPPATSRVRSTITAPNPPAIRRPAFTTLDLSHEAREEAARLLQLRPLESVHASRPARLRRPVIPIAHAPRAFRSGRMTVVIRVTLADASAQPIDTFLLALSLTDSRLAARSTAAATCRHAAGVVARYRTAISAVVLDRARERIRAVDALRTPALARLRQREEELTQQLHSTARDLIQAGLFDRRAIRAADARRRTADILRDDLDAGPFGPLSPAPRQAAPSLQPSFEIRALLLGDLP